MGGGQVWNVFCCWTDFGDTKSIKGDCSGSMPVSLRDIALFVMIVVFKYLFYKNYVGLSFWPFIILRNPDLKEDRVLINHERIHLRQQRELLVLPFYLLYLLEGIVRFFIYFDAYKAYKNISFEREAYQNEADLNYLPGRGPFGFIKYFWAEKQ